MSERIYVVESENEKSRLVKASTRAQAMNHVARSTFTVRVVKVEEALSLQEAGVVVENATSEVEKV